MAATLFLRFGGDWKDVTSFRVVLASPAPTEGSDQPNGDCFARRLPLDPAKMAAAPWMESVEKVKGGRD